MAQNREGQRPGFESQESSTESQTVNNYVDFLTKFKSLVIHPNRAHFVMSRLEEDKSMRIQMKSQPRKFRDETPPFWHMAVLRDDSVERTSKRNVNSRANTKDHALRRSAALSVRRVPPYRNVIGLTENFLVKDSTKPLFYPTAEPENRQAAREVEAMLEFNRDMFPNPIQKSGVSREIASTIRAYYPRIVEEAGVEPSKDSSEDFAVAFNQTFDIELDEILEQDGEVKSISDHEMNRKPAPCSSTHFDLECEICGIHDCEKHGQYVLSDAGSDDEFVEGDPWEGPSTHIERLTIPFNAMAARREEEKGRTNLTLSAHSNPKQYRDLKRCSEDCYYLGEGQEMNDPSPPPYEPLTEEELSRIREADLELGIHGEHQPYCRIAQFLDKPCRQVGNELVIGNELLYRAPSPKSRIPREKRRIPWYDTKKKKITKLDSWEQHTKTHLPAKRSQPKACAHPGFPCSKSLEKGQKCTCVQAGVLCEKFCGCPRDCYLRHTGCDCIEPCLWSRTCPCWLLNRECDPDFCHSRQSKRHICKNNGIQRKLGKRILIGETGSKDFVGLGGFLAEPAKKGEYLAEYVGERITHWEGEVRARYYDSVFVNCSYIFTLNRDCAIDAWRYGNKMRYINHCHKKDQNLEPRILLVNGEHRIGFYATKNIAAGQELLFDYGKHFTQKLKDGRGKDMNGGSGKARKKSATTSLATGRGQKSTNMANDEDVDDEPALSRSRSRGRARGRAKGRGRGKSGLSRIPRPMSPRSRLDLALTQQLNDSDAEIINQPEEDIMGTPALEESSSDEFQVIGEDSEDQEIEDEDEEETSRKSKRARRTTWKQNFKYTR